MKVRSSLGEGSEALMVDALSTEVTLVSRSRLLSGVSGETVFVELLLPFFCSSGGGRAGSGVVFIGSGCGDLFLGRDLSFEKRDRFSG